MSSRTSSSASNISALLKKTEHYDKDERYMATSDLCEVLKANSSNGSGSALSDVATEKQVCNAVLRLLHDNSNDVQAVAVKTLGVLLQTVKEEQVLEIGDSLADQVLDANQSALRDVYAIGLRTLVKTIPSQMGDKTSQRLVGRLLEGVRNSTTTAAGGKEEIILACLDILTDLLGRFGATSVSVTRQHEPLLTMCLTLLVSSGEEGDDSTPSSAVVRKRAGNTLGCLSVVLSDSLLVSMVDRLLGHLDQDAASSGTVTSGGTEANTTRALIRTMCTISGAVGHRLQQAQIDRLIPLFLKFAQPEDAVTGDDEETGDSGDDAMDSDNTMDDDAALSLANELRESCFMGFESFVLRCPTQVEPHLENIIQASLAYMSYDPNYSYGLEETADEDGDENMEEDEYEDEYEAEESDEDDDDDDESWKVRRAAIRAVAAIVEAKKGDPSVLWSKEFPTRKGASTILAMGLVGRFKEREENCRADVLACFTRLLAVTIQASTSGVLSLVDSSESMDTTPAGTSIDLKANYIPNLVKGCEKLLGMKKGGERSKSNALSLLSTLCQAPGGVGGEEAIISIFSHIQPFLANGSGDVALHREQSSKALRLDALSLVRAMLTCESHETLRIQKGLLETLLPRLCEAVQEQWYKVIAEALRALAAAPRFFAAGNAETTAAEKTAVATQIYTAIEPLLAVHDVDQEIKECALTAAAALLRDLHTSLSSEQKEKVLTLLLDRLKNDTTRIVAIKTLSSIAAPSTAEEQVDLSSILGDSIQTMSGFLKLQSRSLKQTALEALDTVVTNQETPLANAKSLYTSVLQELSHLIVDSDLHIAHLSLRAAISILRRCPECGDAVEPHVLPTALVLSTSPLLQELALESLIDLFKEIVKSQAVNFQSLLAQLRGGLAEAGKGKHAMYNLAKCIAIITVSASKDDCQSVLTETQQLLEGTETPADETKLKEVQLALIVSGDVGRLSNLDETSGTAAKFLAIYMGYFESESEELKHAASYALGRAAVGSKQIFLPAMVEELTKDSQKKKYLVLSALRGFIQSSFKQSGGDAISDSLSVIIPQLEKHFDEEEEGVRTMVAECMGSLACMQPALILQKLVDVTSAHIAIEAPEGVIDPSDAVSKKNSLVCWTVGTSIKLAIAGELDPVQLAKFMPSLLKLLEVKELSVRNAALLMVYSTVHHMPQVVSGVMKELIMPSLYEVASFKLQRKVDLGPFKHTVDDALPLRKAAMSIFATCLENLPSSLDVASFMPVLAQALSDVEDVQLQAHQIVISMCQRQPSDVISAVETFVLPLEKTCLKKEGQKTGTELERLEEWKKSSLRAILALSKLEGAMSNRPFADLVERTKANGKFRAAIEALEAEH